MQMPSLLTSLRCAKPSGWYTPDRPSAGPRRWAYLSRYTHRVAISSHRLVSADADTVAFRWKDYRIKRGERQKVMRLETSEFIHRIRHYGPLASAQRKANIARIRQLLAATAPDQELQADGEIVPLTLREPCPDCGGPMRIIEIFRRGQKPMTRAPPREQAA